MNRRQRVHLAIQHKEADRVPTGEWIIDRNLMARILKKNIKELDSFGDVVRVYEFLDIDLKGVDSTFEASPHKELLGKSKSGRPIIKDGWGAVYEDSEFGSLTSSLLEFPIKRPEDVYEYEFPPIGYYERNAREVEKWVKETDFCIGADVWGGRGMITPLMGYENYMTWSLTHPEELGYIIREFTKYNAEIAKMYIDAGAQVIVVDDDLAGNMGPFLSPDFYGEILLPAVREEVGIIKEHAKENNKDSVVFFHSDGDINWIIQDLVEIGIDGLHPLEPAAGMDIGLVKEKYGDKLCLMGNIDTRYVLPRGTPKDVEKEVKRIIKAAASGGGLIISSANMYTADIPVENVSAVYRTVKKYGVFSP